MRSVTIRTTVRPGDVGAIVRMHGAVYSRDYGFDSTFEAYVERPLADFVNRDSARERIWIAERETDIAGLVAIVAASDDEAQLRWFLVDPEARGQGLGTTLLREAVGFCRSRGYASVTLWTVSALSSAARLYREAGFRRIESRPGRNWGVDVVEEKYAMDLRAP